MASIFLAGTAPRGPINAKYLECLKEMPKKQPMFQSRSRLAMFTAHKAVTNQPILLLPYTMHSFESQAYQQWRNWSMQEKIPKDLVQECYDEECRTVQVILPKSFAKVPRMAKIFPELCPVHFACANSCMHTTTCHSSWTSSRDTV